MYSSAEFASMLKKGDNETKDRMSLLTSSIALEKKIRDTRDEESLRPLKQESERQKTISSIIDERVKADTESMSIDERINYEAVGGALEMQRSSVNVDFGNALGAIMIPAQTDDEKNAKSQNFDFVANVMSDNDVAVDTIEGVRGMAASLDQALLGDEGVTPPFVVDAEKIESWARQLSGTEAGADEEPESFAGDFDATSKAFNSKVVEIFQNKYANDEKIDVQARIVNSVTDALADSNQEVSDQQKYILSKGAMETLQQHRNVETQKAMTQYVGQEGIAIEKASGRINDYQYQLAGQNPDDVYANIKAARGMDVSTELVNLMGKANQRGVLFRGKLDTALADMGFDSDSEGVPEGQRRKSIAAGAISVLYTMAAKDKTLSRSEKQFAMKELENMRSNLNSNEGALSGPVQAFMSDVYDKYTAGNTKYMAEQREQIQRNTNNGFASVIDRVSDKALPVQVNVKNPNILNAYGKSFNGMLSGNGAPFIQSVLTHTDGGAMLLNETQVPVMFGGEAVGGNSKGLVKITDALYSGTQVQEVFTQYGEDAEGNKVVTNQDYVNDQLKIQEVTTMLMSDFGGRQNESSDDNHKTDRIRKFKENLKKSELPKEVLDLFTDGTNPLFADMLNKAMDEANPIVATTAVIMTANETLVTAYQNDVVNSTKTAVKGMYGNEGVYSDPSRVAQTIGKSEQKVFRDSGVMEDIEGDGAARYLIGLDKRIGKLKATIRSEEKSRPKGNKTILDGSAGWTANEQRNSALEELEQLRNDVQVYRDYRIKSRRPSSYVGQRSAGGGYGGRGAKDKSFEESRASKKRLEELSL